MLSVIPELIETKRIFLKALSQDDAAFMYQLMNTADWLEFIGDRNIKNIVDAGKYIKKVQESNEINFWVIQLKDQLLPIGVVTVIKKAYLDHPDLGFALLPVFYKKGYAYEGAKHIIGHYFNDPGNKKLLATSLKHNIPSIGLLNKLGFTYDKEIFEDGITMNQYSKISAT
jgi:hypothetical protein